MIQADDPTTLALIENLQREDLDGLETAAALSVLLQERGLTHEQLGALIGKSQAYVSRMLGILELPRWILDDYAANRHVSASAAMVVAETRDPALRLALWEQAKAGLSVRGLTQARKEAAKEKDAGEMEGRRSAGKPSAKAVLRAAQKGAMALREWREQGGKLSVDQMAALKKFRDEIDALLN